MEILRVAIITLGLFLSIALFPLSALNMARGIRGTNLESVQTSIREFSQDQNPPAAGRDFKIKLDVNLVTVDVLVRNSRGNVVDGLRAEDFLVYDNGIQQRLSHFSKDQLPIAIALIIDNSISTASFSQRLQGAALSALKNLKMEDAVVIYFTSNCPARIGVLTQNRNQIADAIGKLPISASDGHYDAIYNACHYLIDQAADRRRAIIMVTDSIIFPQENDSLRVPYINEDDAIRAALDGSVSIHSIKITNPFSPRAAQARVDRLSEGTGGAVLKSNTPEKLSESLNAAIMNLRQTYTLGFMPSNSSAVEGYHRLEIKLKSGRCPDCRVQARNRYFAGSDANPSSVPSVHVEKEKQADDCEKAFVSRKIMEILASKSATAELPFQLQTAVSTEVGGRCLLKFDIHIDAKDVKFYGLWSGKWNHHAGRLAIAAYYVDPDGKAVEEAHWQIIALRVDKAGYMRLVREGISYTTNMPIKDYPLLKIVVYDLATRKAGIKLIKH